MTNYQNNPLRTMFEFLFSGSGNYELNRKCNIKCYCYQNKLRRVVYPKVISCGVGNIRNHIALALTNNGYQVDYTRNLKM